LSLAEPPELTAPEPAPSLTHRHILRFYLPLALSWIFMALEAPISNSIIGRLPDAKLNLAAFAVVFALSLWIESPVIDLLSTSTTLAKNHQHYAVLTRFTQWLIVWVTGLHALIAFTPIYDLLMSKAVLNAPAEVAKHGWLPFAIMIPWSGFIGWRRYLQGILIRYNMTRMVGIGTAVRVCTVAAVGFTLYFFSAMTGAAIAATSLLSSVAAEAIFAHVASRHAIRRHLEKDRPSDAETPPLTYKKLLSFHLPLTATTMVMMLGFPTVLRALHQSPDPILADASWQVCISLLFLLRTITFALPEVVITLYKDRETATTLLRFCLFIGFLTSGTLLLLATTGLDRLFFERVLLARPDIAQMAHIGFLAGVLMPFIGALQSYVRGMLTAHHLTAARLLAVMVAMTVLVAMLYIGVRSEWKGVITAAVAITVSMTAELLVLTWSWRRGSLRLMA
jgi:progressive ankylosis protein